MKKRNRWEEKNRVGAQSDPIRQEEMEDSGSVEGHDALEKCDQGVEQNGVERHDSINEHVQKEASLDADEFNELVQEDNQKTYRSFEGRKSAISVRNVCIDYKSMKVGSIKQSVFSLRKSKQEVFRAVRNVSFEVPEGQILGITGKNGSGKSTMLRAIAGIFSADSGEIDLHGHSISLLAIGVGFKNELSGRENIMLSGLALGFSQSFILEKMPEIIDFAGIGTFIDMPVRTYSSGMHSKLAFSITAILETEIMLIDEVLSVGDQKFKKKSYEKMKELISKQDRTVVIVSHSISMLEDLCDQVIWMHDGEIIMYDKPEIVLPVYRDFMR